MPVHHINEMDPAGAREALAKCCGSKVWCDRMIEGRPYASQEDLLAAAEEIWWSLDQTEWLQAFAQHPKIGDMDSLRAKYASTKEWAAGEQSGCNAASEAVLQGLAGGNSEYEKKFGYIFIVCATGKSADQMLSILRDRLLNNPSAEIKIAAAEQAKITQLRLEKLCQEVPSQPTC
jgi:2-oxo-4-hydroxy-4-carboxy-5-ureidoimidazoline decarboxylase